MSQGNGATFQARKWGDEGLNGFETTSGYSIVYDEYDAQWTYAMPDPDGYLVPSPLAVGIDAAPPWLPQNIRPEGMALQQAIQMSNAMKSGAQTSQNIPTTGTLNVPVILMNFKDTSPIYSIQDFNNLLFGVGTQSMRDYYQEVSYGKLDLSSGKSGIIGWYTASQNHDYYGYNQGLAKGSELVREAVQIADNTINFADSDSDGDCVVDGVMIVHQGTGAESGDHSDIWSHKWAISYTTNDSAACGTIKINKYSIQPEKLGSSISTMGVFAHEFGHVLGLPDLYDTDGPSGGVGNWELMASGSWNGTKRAGDTPANLSAWSKIKLGWVTPTQVTSLLPDEPIESVATSGDIYRFLSGTEYYLIENRLRAGFDTGLPASGLAIWHIDDTKGSNTAECIPPTNCAMNHYRVALVQSDNLYQLEKNQNRGDAGDIFFNGSFSDATTPSAKLYDGSNSLITVKNISGTGKTMKATLCYGDKGILTPSPTSLDFGEVYVGSSKSLVLTLSNTGCADISIGSLTGSSSSFKVKSSTCPTTLVPNDSCTITLSFEPTVAATITNTFSFNNGVSIPLKGIGKATTQTLTTSQTGTGNGTIISSPAGINCGTDCSESYQTGTTITLTANPNDGSQFMGWSGACTGTGSCTVTMNESKAVVAKFDLIPKYNLSVGVSGNGTIQSNPTGIDCGSDCNESYIEGTQVTLTATASTGSQFIGWSGSCSGTGSCTVTMDKAKTVTASFSVMPVPNIQSSANSADFGQATVGKTHYKIFYIYNRGNAPLKISTVSFSGANASEFGEYPYAYYSCSGKTVNSGSRCYEYITFKPTSAGSKNANLVIASNDPDMPNLNIPLTATAKEVSGVVDPACSLTPTITSGARAGMFGGVWAKLNTSTGAYDDVAAGSWDQDRIPNENDVVLIQEGHTMIGIPSVKVKALCNKGILKSKKDSSLEILATTGIANYGKIIGNIDQHKSVKDEGSCAQKDGNSVILKAGTSFSKKGKRGDWWWYGSGAPIYNKGLIEGGPGGNEGGAGIGCVGRGGDAIVLGRNTENTQK
ncbi:MAG: M6 family metalloprotease domain-containing protein, partial [Thiotrichaceae bacterium]